MMVAAAPTVVFCIFVGNLILAVALGFAGRAPDMSRPLWALSIAYGLFALRHLVLILSPHLSPWQSLLGVELLHAGAALSILAGVVPWFERHGRILALSVAIGLWVAGGVLAGLPSWLLTLSVSVFVGLALIAAGWSFWRRRREVSGNGWPVIAFLFVAWGVHKLDYPWLAGNADWAPAGFALGQGLSFALGVALLMGTERERRSRDDEGRRHSQSLLRLQGEAMAATASAIFIADRAGRVEWANQAFARLTGWGEGEAVGKAARRLLMGRQRDARMEAALAKGQVWRGELVLRRRDGSEYVVEQTITPIADDAGRMSHYVVVQEDVTERRRAEERIRFLSNHDPLTALPNRLLFREQVQRAIGRAHLEHGALAVLILDLEDFSQYNDVLGHDGGDKLLLAVAGRLAAAARGVECLARVGGDEFGVLVNVDDDGEAVAELAQTLVAAMRRPFETVGGHEVQVGAVVGVTLYPNDGGDADTLLKNADMAMYRAIEDSPNGYRFFSPVMDAEMASRRRLESDLRRAIQRNELSLVYQPVVATADRRIIGFEALLRWTHATEGLIGPSVFIPMAEGNGMIGPIGEWVLREACQQMRAWDHAGIPTVPVAVNLSALQLKRQDVPLLVRRMLTECGLPANRLELELTETTVMEDADTAQRILAEVAGLGVRLAVDDFGTGYSSLARLKGFPVDKLKIDRSFVRDLAEDESDAAIARAIISMGHAMGLRVVAEGVETAEQMAILAAAGCDAVQGFLFSRPVPAAQAAELLRQGGFLRQLHPSVS